MSKIVGEVISAGRGMADLPGLYRGVVGLRHRGGYTEAAFVTAIPPPRLRRGEGERFDVGGHATLDGVTVEIVGIERSVTDARMLVATLRRVDQPSG
jgi:hypothetical protein